MVRCSAGPRGWSARGRVRCRTGPERSSGLGGPRSDGGNARRGDRPRAGQQGVPSCRRRARNRLGAGHGRADRARRLRARRDPSAARRPAARGRRSDRDHRARRAFSRAHPRATRAGHRQGGPRPPDLDHGGQDHGRLGDADEQGPRGDRGPPPVRVALRAASMWSCTPSRSFTDWSGSPMARCLPILVRTCAWRSPTRSTARERGRPRYPARSVGLGALQFEAVDETAFPCLGLRASGGPAARARAC